MQITILVLLVLAGMKGRELFERHRLEHAAGEGPDYSAPVVVVVLAALAACLMTFNTWGSFWPLVGYALLPGLPLGLGWRLVLPASPERADARFDIHSPNVVADAAALSQALILTQGKDPYFDDTARDLVTALILYLVSPRGWR